MNPNQFVDKWEKVELKERASAQSHFEDVCRLVGHPVPAERDPKGIEFTYEYGVEKSGGGMGFADVWFDEHFAIEYKGKGKYADLGGAYQQLLRYRENLKNPPLLVVCDIENWEIHTNWPGTEKKVYRFNNRDLLNPTHLERVRNLFYAPERLHPRRNTEEVTADAAGVFKTITDNMRQWQAEPERIAHFMTKLVFCLFAEDVALLPTASHSEAGVFSEIVEQTRTEPSKFVKYMHDLFTAMADGGEFMFKTIPYFNGALFEDVQVEELTYEALNQLARAARLNWRSIEPSIFGTLFERSLDPAKRAQLGAHYTSRDDILLIVEPVLMQPLRREWAAIQAEAVPLREKLDAARTERDKVQTQHALIALRDQMLTRLRTIKVLDPACGSGNFLYVALGLLLDLEKVVINHPLFVGLPTVEPGVHPRQLYGIEINPIAHALASIVVWIGYIQWRQNNGYWGHSTPILEALHDNIRLMDAILAFDTDGQPIEPDWPAVEVIVGNPPFLGGSRIRGELGDTVIEQIWQVYDGRVPGFADLVCYWFERARVEIERGRAKRAGLLATNSIRGGVNRRVLERIKESGDIFMAWSDRDWVLDGAAVRVSMVGFDGEKNPTPSPSPNKGRGMGEAELTRNLAESTPNSDEETPDPGPSPKHRGREQDRADEDFAPLPLLGEGLGVGLSSDGVGLTYQRTLDGLPVASINADLTGGVDITFAKPLPENFNMVARGIETGGPFEISTGEAERFKRNPFYNPIIVPIVNGDDITSQVRGVWIIDFEQKPEIPPENFTDVYALLKQRWQEELNDPTRKRKPTFRKEWWKFRRSGEKLRKILEQHSRYIATPRVAKHRLFVWIERPIIPDSALFVIARDDDYFFGVLHSKLHEVWSLRMGTWLGKGNDPRYTPTTTFETFPFPFVPGQEPTADPRYQAIAAAAKQLEAERSAWLNPTPNPSPQAMRGTEGKALQERTLTNLYNALNVYRGVEKISIKKAAGDFAPRLDELHQALDAAVCAAYGWEVEILADEEEILRRLLALNLARAGRYTTNDEKR